MICGVSLAVVNFGKMLLIDNVTIQTAIVVSLTVCAVVIISKLVGGILPLLVKTIGFDPAVMASPFITTIVDAMSLLIYFAIASAMLSM